MTRLDAAVVAVLLLIGAGGYYQGFLRGLTRLAGLVVIGALIVLLSSGITLTGPLQTVLARSLALLGGIVLVVSAITWLINRAVPRSFHASPLNKLFGVVPAFIQGICVLALLLGLLHRLAFDPAIEHYVERGLITGPLIQPFAWLERTFAGLQ
jgi:uncharacterized membrane protein required for colicin V production